MRSFEDLGLAPELVEALASEGIEKPTPLQVEVIPVLRRGTSAVLRAAPGAGLLVAYGAALLDQPTSAESHPGAIVLTTEASRSRSLALSLGRVAQGTGHRVGALGVPWAQPERADILFCTLADLGSAVRRSQVKIEQVKALVIDGAPSVLADARANAHGGEALQALTREGIQITLISEPVTEVVRQWVAEHMRRAVFLPPEAESGAPSVTSLERGTLRVRPAAGDPDAATVKTICELRDEGFEHVLVFTKSDDDAADLGDRIALQGFQTGRPGDPGCFVWLGVDALEARADSADQIEPSRMAIVSADPPSDPDELDRRHGFGSGTAVVLARPHELPHLRRIAQEAGYVLSMVEETVRLDESSQFLERLEAALVEEDLVPYLAFLEPIMHRRGSAEVAAALAALLRKKDREQPLTTEGASPSSNVTRKTDITRGEGRPPAWVRLFLSIGRRDGVAAGDLLGAITGESGVEGSQVGRIDLKDTFSRVEIDESVAEKVMRSLNGTTIRGRSLRVDYDRGERRPRREPAARKKAARKRDRQDGS